MSLFPHLNGVELVGKRYPFSDMPEWVLQLSESLHFENCLDFSPAKVQELVEAHTKNISKDKVCVLSFEGLVGNP